MVDALNKQIEVASKLEIDDFIDVRLELNKSNKSFKRVKRFMLFFIGMFLFMLAALLVLSPSNPALPETAGRSENALSVVLDFLPLIGLFAFILLVLFGMPILVRISAKKHFQSNKLLQKEIKFYFSEEGFSGHSASGDLKVMWDEVFKIVETNKAFVLYASNITAWIIPKRFFKDGNDMEFLKSLINTYLPAKNVVRLDSDKKGWNWDFFKIFRYYSFALF